MGLFTGKVALVTGGTSGIGRAAAVAFAREGAKVVAAGRRKKEGEETVERVKAAGSDGFFVKTDVAREGDVEALVEKTIAAYGRLDYAFNNAGIEEPSGPITDKTAATFDQIMDINVKGVWLSMKHEIPQILSSGGGAIVNTSSIAGLIGFAAMPLYCASKHAVVGLTKAAALEYAKSGVRINAVNPAVIETDMIKRFVGENPEFREQLTGLHPIGRVGKPEEVADAVIWLCSDKASFITGHALVVDGGFTVQ